MMDSKGNKSVLWNSDEYTTFRYLFMIENALEPPNAAFAVYKISYPNFKMLIFSVIYFYNVTKIF